MFRLRRIFVFPLLLALAAGTSAEVRIREVGRYDFTAPEMDPVPEGLSGIAYLGGDRFVVVSDAHAALFPLRIDIDRSSGAVTAARFEDPILLRDERGELFGRGESKDREGVAYDAATKSVWIANERSGARLNLPSIERYELSSGKRLFRLDPLAAPQLAIFGHIHPNRGFEALTRRPDGSESWTSNETPLRVDVESSDPLAGGPLRLQRFDSEMQPTGQYVYHTDPAARAISYPARLAGYAITRVSDLAALPGGALVALESSFQGSPEGLPETRNRIYEVDVSEADDVSIGELGRGLAGHSYRSTSKRLLLELSFLGAGSNYEGIAVGPKLDNGDYCLLLVADNGVGSRQSLYALRLSE